MGTHKKNKKQANSIHMSWRVAKGRLKDEEKITYIQILLKSGTKEKFPFIFICHLRKNLRKEKSSSLPRQHFSAKLAFICDFAAGSCSLSRRDNEN